MWIDPIFYAATIAAIIYSLSFPAECHTHKLADAGDFAAQANDTGRHVANREIEKGRYPAEVPPSSRACWDFMKMSRAFSYGGCGFFVDAIGDLLASRSLRRFRYLGESGRCLISELG